MSLFRRLAAGPPPKPGLFGAGGMQIGPDPGIDGLGVGLGQGREQPPSPLSVVNAIIKVNAGNMAMLPRRVLERDDRTRTPRRDLQFRHLWGMPNGRRFKMADAMPWWESEFAAGEGWANAYIWVDRIPGTTGYVGVDGLYYIHQGRVQPGLQDDGSKGFILDGDRDRFYTADEIIHVMGLSYDGIRGIAPIRAGLGAHDLAMRAERFGRAYFKNGTRLSGVITTESALDEAKRDEFYQQWEKRHGGDNNAGSIAIMGGKNTRWQQITIPPEEAQYLETRMFQREEILGFYAPGLPHHLLGWKSNTSNWGTGIEQQSIGYVTYVLLNRLRRMEDAIESALLPPELELRFEVKGLLRGDVKSRAEVLQKLRMSGALSADQILELEDMPPRGIPDDYLEPANMMRLDAATGELLNEPQGRGARAGRGPRRAPPPGQEEEASLRPPRPTALLSDIRCGNPECSSYKNGRGALLARATGDTEVVCPHCKTKTLFQPHQVVRDENDYAELVADQIVARLPSPQGA